jgi:hypothetical protein
LVGDRVQRRWLSYGLTQCFGSTLFDLWVNILQTFSHSTITDYQMICQMTW